MNKNKGNEFMKKMQIYKHIETNVIYYVSRILR